MAGIRVEGNTSGSVAEVDSSNNLFVNPPGFSAGGVPRGGGDANAGALTVFSEVDGGTKTGSREVLSPEVDKDYRLRVANDNLIDQEFFVDTAQNTGKFFYAFTTMTATSSTAGLLTNSGNITTAATGMTFNSNVFAVVGGTQTYVNETSIAFSAQPNANSFIDFGGFVRGAANPFAPLDGCYFRLTSAGLFGIVNRNGTETPTAPLPLALGAGLFVYTNNAQNRYLIQMNNVSTSFWINNYKFGEIVNPVGAGFPCAARGLAWGIRHAIVGGAAGAAIQALVSDYRVMVRGPQYSDRLGIVGNRVLGAYQGQSGGTMGSLATLPNNTNPTAAVPTNTALTANLPAGIGGQGLVTAQAASTTDLIFGQSLWPVASSTGQNKRLVVRGIVVDALNMGAAVATTATAIQFSVAWGHTAASLATAESGSFVTATAKAPRRLSLGFMSWPIGAAIAAPPSNGGKLFLDLGDAPLYVNPGEHIALVGKFIAGTATASQTIWFTWQPIYGSE